MDKEIVYSDNKIQQVNNSYIAQGEETQIHNAGEKEARHKTIILLYDSMSYSK